MHLLLAPDIAILPPPPMPRGTPQLTGHEWAVARSGSGKFRQSTAVRCFEATTKRRRLEPVLELAGMMLPFVPKTQPTLPPAPAKSRPTPTCSPTSPRLVIQLVAKSHAAARTVVQEELEEMEQATGAVHPECTSADECVGSTESRLVRHLPHGIGTTGTGDLYCEHCWDNILQQFPDSNLEGEFLDEVA